MVGNADHENNYDTTMLCQMIDNMVCDADHESSMRHISENSHALLWTRYLSLFTMGTAKVDWQGADVMQVTFVDKESMNRWTRLWTYSTHLTSWTKPLGDMG